MGTRIAAIDLTQTRHTTISRETMHEYSQYPIMSLVPSEGVDRARIRLADGTELDGFIYGNEAEQLFYRTLADLQAQNPTIRSRR